MEDDIADYRILEFFLGALLLLSTPAEAAQCHRDEVLQGGLCVCKAGHECTRTPFHNDESYVCCAVIAALLVANLASTLDYSRGVVHELAFHLRQGGLSKRDARLSFALLNPPNE